MAALIAEFFGLIGADMTPPETMAELIPYLLYITLGVVLVCAVFRVIGKLAELLMDYKRW